MRPIDADHLNMYLCELQMANLGEDDDYCETLNEVIHIVDGQPTIEAETVKHGEWVEDGDFLICLNCESEINIKNSLGVENRKNFCPNCGADMRERKENG